MLSGISNSTVTQKENEERYRQGELLRAAEREESLSLSLVLSFFLSPGPGQVPTSMYFTVWLGGHRECWPVMHGAESLCPCPHFLPCQANDDDDDNEKEEDEIEKGNTQNLARLPAV